MQILDLMCRPANGVPAGRIPVSIASHRNVALMLGERALPRIIRLNDARKFWLPQAA
jgi:hypothetical protein